MELVICALCLGAGAVLGNFFSASNRAGNTLRVSPERASTVNIKIVHIDNRDERHYTLQGQEHRPLVAYKGEDSLTLLPVNPYVSPLRIKGRDEMKLLQASINDIAKVDKWG